MEKQYSFIAYDNVGNDTVMYLNINNIDKEGVSFILWEEEIEEGYYQIGWEIDKDANDFKHILLPNNIYSTEKQGYFDVQNLGTYTFLAYDEAGNETRCEITIKGKNN